MFSNQNFRFQLVLVAGAIALLYPWIGATHLRVGAEALGAANLGRGVLANADVQEGKTNTRVADMA